MDDLALDMGTPTMPDVRDPLSSAPADPSGRRWPAILGAVTALAVLTACAADPAPVSPQAPERPVALTPAQEDDVPPALHAVYNASVESEADFLRTGTAPAVAFPAAAITERDNLVEAAALDSVRRSLKDPDSARFQGVSIKPKPQIASGAYVVCGRVNARNPDGGDAGDQLFYSLVSVRAERLAAGEATLPEADPASAQLELPKYKRYCRARRANRPEAQQVKEPA